MHGLGADEDDAQSLKKAHRRARTPFNPAHNNPIRCDRRYHSPPFPRLDLVHMNSLGRVTSSGVLLPFPPPSQRSNPFESHSSIPLHPEEALFKARNAPDRHPAYDFYWADSRLDERDPRQRLPDSDLLKAVHWYAAAFYARGVEGGGEVSVRSLDETALLALGVLLEEAGREVLGKDGEWTLMEAEELDLNVRGREFRGRSLSQSRSESRNVGAVKAVSEGRRGRKRKAD